METSTLGALGAIWGGSTALVVGWFDMKYTARVPRLSLVIWSIRTEFGMWADSEGSERVYPMRRDVGARSREPWEVPADVAFKRAPVSGSRAIPAFQVPMVRPPVAPADEAVWREVAHVGAGRASGRHRA